MKKVLSTLFVFLFVALFLFSCVSEKTFTTEDAALTLTSAENAGKEGTTEEETESEVKTEETETLPPVTLPETGEEPPETEEPPTVHVHEFVTVTETPATCLQFGLREKKCSCGVRTNEYLPIIPHSLSDPDCTRPSTCAYCHKNFGEALGHNVVDGVCLRCSAQVQLPIRVLGQNLDFDETAESFYTKLGAPTTIITEGSFVSYVYASDLTRLTIIQTDNVGLWGVFTMDTDARLYLDGREIRIGNFSGSKDGNSDAYYQDTSTCRLFGFRDSKEGGEYYALWMRYSDCRYDYMNDPAIYNDFEGQNRISFYYVNALRARKGLAPLTWSDAASQVATEYAQHMIDENYFDHDNSYGNRLTQKGVPWRYAGENISLGYYNAFFVCDAYYNSEGHRVNILNPAFTYVGMGYARRNSPACVLGGQVFYCK